MNTLEVKLSGAVLSMLQSFQQQYDSKHSLQYVLEDALVAGLNAKRRSKEYSEATENRKRFEREIAANPGIVLDPVGMLALMKKYRIGASNQNLEEQVLKAAEKLQEAELEKATAPAPAATAASASTAA